jgi:putative ATP-dependent endonuclease of OLD family
MRLHSLSTNGFKRIEAATFLFGDATFLIGPNNVGKSGILKAIEILLSADKRLDQSDYFSVRDPDTGETKVATKTVVLTGEFRNVPAEATGWRGFKGRIFPYDAGESGETGLSITYRKTYALGEDVSIEIKTKKRHLKDGFQAAKKPQDLIDAGADTALITEIFSDLDKTISTAQRSRLDEIDELWEIEEAEDWFKNPGGIPGNVLVRLPRFLPIPADSSEFELHDEKKGVLGKTLGELFEDVRSVSENYKSAQEHLKRLAKELDPNDQQSRFGQMLKELNDILAGVFPGSQLHVAADLSSPDSLKPAFQIELSSNIRTKVQKQGTGMVRSAVFGILRYRQRWLAKREDKSVRSLIIGFEEPEIYLHPSAANQMRDTIYELSRPDCQIVATTHSPYLIDLSRKPRQVLNRFGFEGEKIVVTPFNVTRAFGELHENDKTYVKMLLRLDSHAARMFFTKNVVIVEGDTEEVVFKESLRRLPKSEYLKILADWEVMKARGKAAIIPLVSYLKAVGIQPMVMHDRDAGVAGAEVFNQPIINAAGEERVVCLHECLEDVLGYPAPSTEKPFKAFQCANSWGEKWEDVPEQWRTTMRRVFGDYVKLTYPADPAVYCNGGNK